MYSNQLNTDNYNIKSWYSKFSDFNVDLFQLFLHTSYKEFYESDIFTENLKLINKYLSHCLNETKGKINIFPYPDLVFNALNITPLDKIKIVILGQDPYFNSRLCNGEDIPEAMGLSFSVPKNMPIPSSLKNIYKNLLKYGHIKKIPEHGNLSFWAYQGILLLNTILTVQKGHPNGHLKKWTKLTDALIKFISDNTNNVVFLLWGANAYEKYNLIDDKKHKIIVSSHPSGLSCNKPFKTFKCFNETDHFSEANKYLEKHNKTSVIFEII